MVAFCGRAFTYSNAVIELIMYDLTELYNHTVNSIANADSETIVEQNIISYETDGQYAYIKFSSPITIRGKINTNINQNDSYYADLIVTSPSGVTECWKIEYNHNMIYDILSSKIIIVDDTNIPNYSIFILRINDKGVCYDNKNLSFGYEFNRTSSVRIINTWVENAYIKTNVNIGSNVDLNPTSENGYRCAVVNCEEGDIFTITVLGATIPRAWAFVDVNDALIAVAASNANDVDYVLTAPPNAKKLILNDHPTDGIFSSLSYYGRFIDSQLSTIENEITQTSNNNIVKLPFKLQKLMNLTDGNIVESDKNISTDRIHLYGEYSIDFPIEYEVLVATFWDGWNVLSETSAYSNGWDNTGHIDLLARASDEYVINVRRKDNALISLQEANNIVVKKITNTFEELKLKNWTQGTTNGNGAITDSQTRISSSDILAFPFRGTFTIKLTTGFAVGIRSGARSDSMPSNIYWLTNGDKFVVPNGHNYFRIIMAKYTGTNNPQIPITPSDAKDVMCSLCWGKSPSIIDSNDQAIKLLDAASLIFNTTGTNEKRAVIAHTSDVHGDTVRLNRFAEFCDFYGVDYGAITGDLVAYNVNDGSEFIQDIFTSYDTQFGICIGNHDVRGDITDSEVYSILMAPNANKLGNNTGKNYYYKDIDSQKLRIISISLYEDGIVESGNRRPANQHMSSDQLLWLCTTLKTTPANYGIMIMMHTIQSGTPITQAYNKFYQTPLKYSSAGNESIDGAPVFDIVDSFVSRTSINKSYTQTGTPSSISVSDDFSSVDTSVEFVAFMVGHFHADAITYTSTTNNKLLVLNVTCTNSIYGGEEYPYLADVSDLHRNGRTSSQDAFNVYTIDRDSKIVHVVRIGANTTYNMENRQYMAIPYILD